MPCLWRFVWLIGYALQLCTTDGLPSTDARDQKGFPKDKVQLRDWLRMAHVELPAFQVPLWLLDHLGIHVEVTNCTCWHIDVQHVEVPAAHGEMQRLQFTMALAGLSLECSMAVNVRMLGRFHRGVQVDATVEDAGATVEFGISSDGELPTAGTVDQCSLHLRLAPLRFGGAGIIPSALRVAEPLVRNALEEHSTGIVCDIVHEIMHKSASYYMEQADDVLRHLLTPALPISWHSVHGSADLRNLLWSGTLGTVLRSGFQEVAHTDNMTLFNKFVSELLVSFQLVDDAMVSHLPNLARSLRMNTAVPLTNGSALLKGSVQALEMDLLNLFRSLCVSILPQVFEVSGVVSPGAAVSGQVAIVLPQGVAQVSTGFSALRLIESVPLAPVKFSASFKARVDSKLSTLALFDSHKTSRLQLDQLQRPGCLSHSLLPAHLSLGLIETNVNASLLELELKLPELDSVTLEDQLMIALTALAEAANATFGITAVRLIAGIMSGAARDQTNSLIEETLPASSDTFCPASNFTSGHIEVLDFPARWGMVFCLVIAAVLTVRGLRPTRAQAGHHDARDDLYCESFTSAESRLMDGMGCAPCELSRVALGRHPAVPPAMRTAMPWLLLGNAFLFVVAAFTPGVLVAVVATKPHAPQWMSPGIVVISISNTLDGMWSSQVYLLWFLVVAFSVAWPYVKLAVMLHIWLRPMGSSLRGRLLVFLDQVGKWSLADNFIMLLFIVFFHVSWIGTDATQPLGEASDGSTSIEIKCLPQLEFYAFIVGTICSLVLGHVVLEAHRHAHGAWYIKKAEAAVADPMQPLWRMLHKSGAVSALPPGLLAVGVAMALLLILALVGAAMLVPVLTLEMGGVVGTFFDVTDQPRKTWWSMATIVSHLVSPQEDLCLALLLAFFMVILPLLLHLSLLMIWLLPLRSGPRLRLFAVCQTLAAWSSLDVAAVAVLGAVIGGDNYGIAAFLNMVIYNGTVAPLCNGLRDSAGLQCLTTHLELQAAYWVLFAAAMASLVACQGIFRAVHISQKETIVDCNNS